MQRHKCLRLIARQQLGLLVILVGLVIALGGLAGVSDSHAWQVTRIALAQDTTVRLTAEAEVTVDEALQVISPLTGTLRSRFDSGYEKYLIILSVFMGLNGPWLIRRRHLDSLLKSLGYGRVRIYGYRWGLTAVILGTSTLISFVLTGLVLYVCLPHQYFKYFSFSAWWQTGLTSAVGMVCIFSLAGLVGLVIVRLADGFSPQLTGERWRLSARK